MTEQKQAEPEGDEQQQEQNRDSRRDEQTRTRLREAEAERDALRQRVDDRDRRDVQAMARSVLGEAGVALLPAYDLDAIRDPDSGDVDPDKVQALIAPVKAALDEGRVQHHGDLGAKAVSAKANGPTWAQIIQASKR